MPSYPEMLEAGDVVRLYCVHKYCAWVSLPCHKDYQIVEHEAYINHHRRVHTPEPLVVRHLVKKDPDE